MFLPRLGQWEPIIRRIYQKGRHAQRSLTSLHEKLSMRKGRGVYIPGLRIFFLYWKGYRN